MYLSYIDESGDDGFPNTSSNLFVLSALYIDDLLWRDNYLKIYNFRKKLKAEHNFPIKMEFHTKQFLTDKNPYRDFKWSYEEKREIIYKYLNLINNLDVKFINVGIRKDKIIDNKYDILDKSMTYLIQRIENDLKQSKEEKRFILICDEGRIKKVIQTARRLQRFNFIQSKFDGAYRKEIELLIEDPFAKSSSESWILQISDLMATLIFYYIGLSNNICKIPKRMKNVINEAQIFNMIEIVKNKLNIKASNLDEYGVVVYPK